MSGGVRPPPAGHHALIAGVAFVSDGGKPVDVDVTHPSLVIPEGEHDMTVAYWVGFALRELALPVLTAFGVRRIEQALRIARFLGEQACGCASVEGPVCGVCHCTVCGREIS